MKAFVYILQDKNKRYYVGSTTDLARRLKQHSWSHTQTTARMIAPRLVLSQEYNSLETARKIEKKIKSLKRKDYINKMISDGYIKLSI